MRLLVLITLVVVFFAEGAKAQQTTCRFLSSRSYQLSGFADSMAMGDLNGDQQLDFVQTDSAGHIWVLMNRGDGTFDPRVSYEVGSDSVDVELAEPAPSTEDQTTEDQVAEQPEPTTPAPPDQPDVPADTPPPAAIAVLPEIVVFSIVVRPSRTSTYTPPPEPVA